MTYFLSLICDYAYTHRNVIIFIWGKKIKNKTHNSLNTNNYKN